VRLKPIREMTGESEFNETFFDGARTAAGNIVGAPGDGWKVAMGTLAFERGVSTLAQQMDFRNELDAVIAAAARERLGGRPAAAPAHRRRAHRAQVMRYSALRMLTNNDAGSLSNEAYTYRLHWGVWRKKLGELAMDVLGRAARSQRHAPLRMGRARAHVPVLTLRHESTAARARSSAT
jgi:alkylation response protein AidB-like acyl-CoA dehydrogenase